MACALLPLGPPVQPIDLEERHALVCPDLGAVDADLSCDLVPVMGRATVEWERAKDLSKKHPDR
jgi:hypothetical protein